VGQPIIAKKPTGEWVYSYLDYRLESATYQRIAGEIDVGERFLEEDTPKCSGDYEHDERRRYNISWFRFTSQWRLSMPLTSGAMSDTAAPGQIDSIVSQWTTGRLGSLVNR